MRKNLWLVSVTQTIDAIISQILAHAHKRTYSADIRRTKKIVNKRFARGTSKVRITRTNQRCSHTRDYCLVAYSNANKRFMYSERIVHVSARVFRVRKYDPPVTHERLICCVRITGLQFFQCIYIVLQFFGIILHYLIFAPKLFIWLEQIFRFYSVNCKHSRFPITRFPVTRPPLHERVTPPYNEQTIDPSSPTTTEWSALEFETLYFWQISQSFIPFSKFVKISIFLFIVKTFLFFSKYSKIHLISIDIFIIIFLVFWVHTLK